MKKRLLVLLMALAMCFAMFGCGSADEATTDDAAAPEDTTAVEPADPADKDTAAPTADDTTTDAPTEEAPEANPQ